MKHTLTQEPDAQGYGDGLEDWDCSCGEWFSAGQIDQAFEHGYNAALIELSPPRIEDDPKHAQELGY